MFINEHPVKKMCKVLNISRDSYYKWLKKRRKTELTNKILYYLIKYIYSVSRERYGYRKIYHEIKRLGYQVNKKRIYRIMKENKIQAKLKKRIKKTTQSDSQAKYSPNIVSQDFRASQKDQLWLSDITYIRTKEGWLHLAVVLDVYSRRIVGYSFNERMPRELAIDALEDALSKREISVGLIFHSDRGSQYTSKDFRAVLAKNGIIQSMSGTGNCYDNAMMESFFNLLKSELVNSETYQTREQAKKSIVRYIELFYNRVRIHSALNYLSPDEFENNKNNYYFNELKNYSNQLNNLFVTELCA